MPRGKGRTTIEFSIETKDILRRVSERLNKTYVETGRHYIIVFDRPGSTTGGFGGVGKKAVASLVTLPIAEADPEVILSLITFDRPAKVVPHQRRSVVIHPAYDRPLTVRELARLHTYPDWFSFEPLGVDAAMRAIADSVPPKFSEKLAKAIREALQV